MFCSRQVLICSECFISDDKNHTQNRKRAIKELKSQFLSWPFLFKKEPSNPYPNFVCVYVCVLFRPSWILFPLRLICNTLRMHYTLSYLQCVGLTRYSPLYRPGDIEQNVKDSVFWALCIARILKVLQISHNVNGSAWAYNEIALITYLIQRSGGLWNANPCFKYLYRQAGSSHEKPSSIKGSCFQICHHKYIVDFKLAWLDWPSCRLLGANLNNSSCESHGNLLHQTKPLSAGPERGTMLQVELL